LVVVLLTGVQQVDNHVITPNIMSRTVKVHPATVIIALAAAAAMFGIVGMFLAIPTVAAAKLILVYLLVTRVPSMAHLGEDAPALFNDDGVLVETQREDSAIFAMGRDLRTAWERVRGRDNADDDDLGRRRRPGRRRGTGRPVGTDQVVVEDGGAGDGAAGGVAAGDVAAGDV